MISISATVTIINNSLAFGGYNAVTVFAKPGVLPPPTGNPEARA